MSYVARTHHIDFEQAQRVATTFLDAPSVSNERTVVAAYAALGAQVEAWFARLTGPSARRPVRVVNTRCPDPYTTAVDLAEQVRSERVLELCPAQYDRDRLHPLLDVSIGGTYDRFRAVHDIISHAWLGYGFDRDGEFSAWVAEDRLYRGLARWALATELHAEHSVRWTTGDLAPHKAALLPASLIAASRARAHDRGSGTGPGPRTRGSPGGEHCCRAVNVSSRSLPAARAGHLREATMLHAPAAVRSSRFGDPDLEQAGAEFAQLRPRLMGIAYRILGSWTEAEDIVQDAWLRWQTYDRTSVENTTAFMVTTTTRLAINAAQSARARRESYVGRWLPEPVDTSEDPALGAERGAALELGLLLLLEQLSPSERAAYILRQAFDYPYPRIAEMLQLTEANVRQIVSRAGKHLTAEARRPATRTEQQRLMRAFVAAAQHGDVDALERVLTPDAVSLSDGGGAMRAARFPVVGRERVAVFVARISKRVWPGRALHWTEANGAPTAVLTDHGGVVAAVAATTSARGIEQVMWLVNPAKLSGLSCGHDGKEWMHDRPPA